MNNETIRLAELYVNSRIKDLGKARSFHPVAEDIAKRRDEAIKEVEAIIGEELIIK